MLYCVPDCRSGERPALRTCLGNLGLGPVRAGAEAAHFLHELPHQGIESSELDLIRPFVG